MDRYADCQPFHPEYSVLSHDQIIGLMLGFTLLKRYVSPNLSHNEENLIEKTQAIANGIS